LVAKNESKAQNILITIQMSDYRHLAVQLDQYVRCMRVCVYECPDNNCFNQMTSDVGSLHAGSPWHYL